MKKYFKHDTWTDILQAKGMGIIYIRIFEILWTCSHKGLLLKEKKYVPVQNIKTYWDHIFSFRASPC